MLSWACNYNQEGSVVSMAKQDEKYFLTSSSNSFKEPARLGGVALARWTNLQKLPHKRKRDKATCGSIAATSTKEDMFLGISTLSSDELRTKQAVTYWGTKNFKVRVL